MSVALAGWALEGENLIMRLTARPQSARIIIAWWKCFWYKAPLFSGLHLYLRFYRLVNTGCPGWTTDYFMASNQFGLGNWLERVNHVSSMSGDR
ncbi:hypothetical protein LCGC14_0093590 [marine sediment metagenome]|uniref:Uncharacterized protein n=1 Tax=marine sediment metagenome TaxID=412755 RepID=A0A0F9XX10_9ZZZZ